MPLRPWELVVTDRFSLDSGVEGDSFARGNSLSLQPLPSLRLKADSSAVYEGGEEELSQSWEGAGSVTLNESFSLALSSRWSLLTAGEITGIEGYSRTWINGYRFLLSREDGVPRQRKMNLQGTMSGVWGRVSPELEFSAESFNVLDREDPEQTVAAGGTMKLPLRLGSGPQSWLMTPFYGRNLKIRSEESGEGFYDDLSVAGSLFYQSLALGAAWPGEDLFSPSLGEELIIAGEEPLLLSLNFTPSWGFTLSRPVGSWLSNLYLPTGLDFLQERSLIWKDGTDDDLLSTKLTLRFSFLNLFGRLGAYPRFSFYDTEEVVTIFGFKWVEDKK